MPKLWVVICAQGVQRVHASGGPWPHHSQGLFQCLWFWLSPKAELMPRVCSNSWDNVGAWELCCCRGHADQGGLCCHLGPCWHLVRASATGHIWVYGPCHNLRLMTIAIVTMRAPGNQVLNQVLIGWSCWALPAPQWDSHWYNKLDDPSMCELATSLVGAVVLQIWKWWSHPSPWAWESWYHTSPNGDGPRTLLPSSYTSRSLSWHSPKSTPSMTC